MVDRDPITREADGLIDSALDDLCEKIDRLRDKHGLTDAAMALRLDEIDLAEAFLDWAHEGEQG